MWLWGLKFCIIFTRTLSRQKVLKLPQLIQSWSLRKSQNYSYRFPRLLIHLYPVPSCFIRSFKIKSFMGILKNIFRPFLISLSHAELSQMIRDRPLKIHSQGFRAPKLCKFCFRIILFLKLQRFARRFRRCGVKYSPHSQSHILRHRLLSFCLSELLRFR